MIDESIELTEGERDLLQVASALFGWATQDEAQEALEKGVLQILADRLRGIEAERDHLRTVRAELTATLPGLEAAGQREWDRADKAEARLKQLRDGVDALAVRCGTPWSCADARARGLHRPCAACQVQALLDEIDGGS